MHSNGKLKVEVVDETDDDHFQQIEVKYPVFSALSDVLEQNGSDYDYPPDGTRVYTSWSCAVIELLTGKKHGLSVEEIQEQLLGSWILRGSKQYVQLCWGNIDFWINEFSLTMCFLFDDSTGVWVNRQEALYTNNRVFLFQSEKSLSFAHVIYHTLRNLLAEQDSVRVEVLMESLNGVTYRTVFGNHMQIDSVKDSNRIIYTIECIDEFQINDDVIIRERRERVFSNDAVRILAENDPLFCGYTQQQVCALLGIEGDETARKEALKELVSCDEVFYYNESIGVRPEFRFTKQPAMKTEKFPWVYESVFAFLSTIESPCELGPVMDFLTGNKLSLNADNTNFISMGNSDRIKAFLDTHPMIVCKSGEYFMIPLDVEADLYGGLYFTQVKNIVTKYQVKVVCRACAMRVESLRWPGEDGQCKFIIDLTNGVQTVAKIVRTLVKWQRSRFSEEFAKEELERNQVVIVEEICGNWDVPESEKVPEEEQIVVDVSSQGEDYMEQEEEEEEEVREIEPVKEEVKERKRPEKERVITEKQAKKPTPDVIDGFPVDISEKLSKNMSLVDAIGLLFTEHEEEVNGYLYLDLKTILSVIHGHQFKLSNGVQYTIDKSKHASKAIVVAEMLGSDQFQPKKTDFSYIGRINADYSIAFDGFVDLAIFAAREFHIKRRQSGLCMTMDDLVKECCGRVYLRRECNRHTWVVTDQFGLRRTISSISKKRGSILLYGVEGGVEMFGLLEFCSPKYRMEPKEERIKWPAGVRKEYEEAFANRHEPSQADVERHEKHRQELMKRTAKEFAKKSRHDRGLDEELLALRDAGNSLMAKMAQTGHVHNSDAKSYSSDYDSFSDSESDPVPAPENTLKSKPKQETKVADLPASPLRRQPSMEQTNLLNNQQNEGDDESETLTWDPPAITFKDYGSSSGTFTVHKNPTRGLPVPNRFIFPANGLVETDTLCRAIDKKVPNLEALSFDDLVADLHSKYGNGKTHDDFALDVVRAIGKLKAMRDRN